MFELASGYRDRGMAAYSELQQAEFASEAAGYTATRHQREVGTGYFDAVAQRDLGRRRRRPLHSPNRPRPRSFTAARRSASRPSTRRKTMGQRYWVVGGQYSDCRFKDIEPGTEIVHGPLQ